MIIRELGAELGRRLGFARATGVPVPWGLWRRGRERGGVGVSKLDQGSGTESPPASAARSSVSYHPSKEPPFAAYTPSWVSLGAVRCCLGEQEVLSL